MNTIEKLLNLAKAKTEKTVSLEQKNEVFDQLCANMDTLIKYSNAKAKYGIRTASGAAIYDINVDEELDQFNRIKDAASVELAEQYDKAAEAIETLNDMALNEGMDEIFNVDVNDEKQVDNAILQYMKDAYDIEIDTQANIPETQVELDDDDNKTKNRLKELDAEFGDILNNDENSKNVNLEF